MVASVGVAVCVRVGGLSVGVYVGSAAGQSGAPWCGRGSGGPVLLPLGWLPAVGRAQARWVVLGVAGSLSGSWLVPCAGVRCRGAARPGYQPPPYSWGRVGLRSWQVMLGVPGSLWPCGVVLVVVAPPVWTHALVGSSVVCRP